MPELTDAERDMLEVVHEAAIEGRDWRAAVKWLEMHFPEKYKSHAKGGRRPGAGKKKGMSQAPDRVKLKSVS